MNNACKPVAPRPGNMDHLILVVLQFGYRIAVRPDSEYSPHSVARALKRLRAQGWLIRETPMKPGANRGTFVASLQGASDIGDTVDAHGNVLAVEVLDHGFKVPSSAKGTA